MVGWMTYSIHKTNSLEELNDKVIEELRLEKRCYPGPIYWSMRQLHHWMSL